MAAKCDGIKGYGTCVHRPKFLVERTQGPSKPMYACGVHLAQVIKYRLAPGHAVTVTQIEQR